jgi:hypothetical protein
MKADVAKEVLEAAFESGQRLTRALGPLADGASPEEHDKYRDVISRLLVTMLLEIINPLLAEHPELRPDEMKPGWDG